jgi:RNA polymerase sigma-70 factor (ECF subfamily)
MDAMQAFEAHRPLMFSIAYRMMGSAMEAEDIVQEAYLRYQKVLPEAIDSHKAFLTTVVTRLCINALNSARSQRETYIGPWLPEPMLTSDSDSSAAAQQEKIYESVSVAFLILLESLTALERAVFLLREAFDYDYAEIAQMVGREEAACRQLFSRAKKHIAEHRPRFKPSPDEHRQMLEQFSQAVAQGNLDGLLQMLAEDITLRADGGGKARGAATRPLHGRALVAPFVLASTRLANDGDFQFAIETVNHEPALVVRVSQQAVAVILLKIEAGLVQEIWVVGNPDKLKHV